MSPKNINFSKNNFSKNLDADQALSEDFSLGFLPANKVTYVFVASTCKNDVVNFLKQILAMIIFRGVI